MAGHRHDPSLLSDPEVRVRVLETILVDKGYVDPAALDELIETYGSRSGRATVRGSSHAPGAILPIGLG